MSIRGAWLGAMFAVGFTASSWAGPLGNLRFGQVLTIQCSERGCFHGREVEIVFNRTDQLHLEVFEFESLNLFSARQRLGSAVLASKEADALDALFAAFPPPSELVSSTAVRVRLRLSSPGEPDRWEHRVQHLEPAPEDFGGALFALAERVRSANPMPSNPVPILEAPAIADEATFDAWLEQEEAMRQLAQDYRIEFRYCLNVGPGEAGLGLKLVARVPQLVDVVEWEIPIVDRRLVLRDVRPVLAQAGRHLDSLSWLKQWKARSHECKIILSLRGTEAESSGDVLANYLQPVWNQAGLRGRLRWRVEASRLRYDEYRGCHLELLVGDQDRRVVLVEARPAKPSGWSTQAPPFELVEVGRSYDDKSQASYAIIQPDGETELREATLPLPKW